MKGTSRISNTQRNKEKLKIFKNIFYLEKKHEETPIKRDMIQGENHGQTVHYVRK